MVFYVYFYLVYDLYQIKPAGGLEDALVLKLFTVEVSNTTALFMDF